MSENARKKAYNLLLKALDEWDWDVRVTGDMDGSWRVYTTNKNNLHIRITDLVHEVEMCFNKKQSISFMYHIPFTKLNRAIRKMARLACDKHNKAHTDNLNRAIDMFELGGMI